MDTKVNKRHLKNELNLRKQRKKKKITRVQYQELKQ